MQQPMIWNNLISETELENLKTESNKHPILIFKHSIRCPISNMTLDKLESSWNAEEMGNIKPYFLDIINYRPVSNKVAVTFNIEHESPQLLLIENGECVYTESHMGIQYQELKKVMTRKANNL